MRFNGSKQNNFLEINDYSYHFLIPHYHQLIDFKSLKKLIKNNKINQKYFLNFSINPVFHLEIVRSYQL